MCRPSHSMAAARPASCSTGGQSWTVSERDSAMHSSSKASIRSMVSCDGGSSGLRRRSVFRCRRAAYRSLLQMVVKNLRQAAALAMLGSRQLGRQRLQLGGAAGGHGRPLGHPLFERFVERLELLFRLLALHGVADRPRQEPAVGCPLLRNPGRRGTASTAVASSSRPVITTIGKCGAMALACATVSRPWLSGNEGRTGWRRRTRWQTVDRLRHHLHVGYLERFLACLGQRVFQQEGIRRTVFDQQNANRREAHGLRLPRHCCRL